MASVVPMGRVGSKAMLVVIVIVLTIVGVPLMVKASRDLKNDDVVHPQNFFGGVGSGIYSSPSLGGGIPGTGAGTGVGVGVSGHGSTLDFCSFPGLGCVRVEPTNPGAGVGGGGGGVGGTPLPFP